MCGVFVSTGTQGGGQEVTIANSLSTFVHHGLIYVPLGYKHTFSQMSNLTEVHGGTSTCHLRLHIQCLISFPGIPFFPPLSPQVLLGVREHLEAWMAPANPLHSNWKSHLSKVRASGRSSPSTTLSPSKLSSLAFFSSSSAHVYLARWSSARVAVVCRGSGVHDARNLAS